MLLNKILNISSFLFCITSSLQNNLLYFPNFKNIFLTVGDTSQTLSLNKTLVLQWRKVSIIKKCFYGNNWGVLSFYLVVGTRKPFRKWPILVIIMYGYQLNLLPAMLCLLSHNHLLSVLHQTVCSPRVMNHTSLVFILFLQHHLTGSSSLIAFGCYFRVACLHACSTFYKKCELCNLLA